MLYIEQCVCQQFLLISLFIFTDLLCFCIAFSIFHEIIVSFKSWRVRTVLLCEYRTLRDFMGSFQEGRQIKTTDL